MLVLGVYAIKSQPRIVKVLLKFLREFSLGTVYKLGKIMLRTVVATRYITPLREGGSLPALVEADDGECYVMKFAGAGQGVKALIAEVLAGEIARTLGLPIPELVYMELGAEMDSMSPMKRLKICSWPASG